MSRGILEMLWSATTLVFAIPVVLAGVELLLHGDHLIGVGLLAVALIMVVIDQYVTTPGDLPVLAANKLAGGIALPPEEKES